jgi:hypothetical protein
VLAHTNMLRIDIRELEINFYMQERVPGYGFLNHPHADMRKRLGRYCSKNTEHNVGFRGQESEGGRFNSEYPTRGPFNNPCYTQKTRQQKQT